MNLYRNFASASTYNCDAYGQGAYNESCAATQAVDSRGSLADTGMPVIPMLVGGALLIIIGAALLLTIYKQKSKKPQ